MIERNKCILMILFSIIINVHANAQSVSKYKCMIQLNNYTGPAAYIVISLINKNDEYEKTLYVYPPDELRLV